MIGHSFMQHLTDGYLQTFPLVEVHGVQERKSVGTIILVIWTFRMPANSEIQKEFMPEKKWLRIDPIDNQRGEFEYEDHGLRFSQLDVSQELISMEDIEK